uniref:hypothetical protein n=1 Tax=Dermacoccus nishinomiyaensis TaxID=1274 RepID=UPI00164311E5
RMGKYVRLEEEIKVEVGEGRWGEKMMEKGGGWCGVDVGEGKEGVMEGMERVGGEEVVEWGKKGVEGTGKVGRKM